MKIAIIALENIDNVGDEILGIETQWLINHCDNNCTVKRLQFDPTLNDLEPWKTLKIRYFIANNAIRCSYHLIKNKSILLRINELLKYFYLKQYWHKALVDVDAIVTAIGMIKYKTQGFGFLWKALLDTAEELDIPSMISAASVAAPDEKDRRFLELKKSLNNKCVKVITTRDGKLGVSRLEKHYIYRTSIRVCEVGDPALWIPETFNVIRNKQSKTVGINLIRDNIFRSYGKTIVPEQLKSIYIGLLNLLDDKGIKWKLFCNGIEDDFKFGISILEEMKLDRARYLIKKPHNANEYIETICGFERVLGARLHACLTSYSLGIPFVGYIWDDKLEMFGKAVGLERNMLLEEELTSNNLWVVLQKASLKGSEEEKERLKQLTYSSIKRFINESKSDMSNKRKIHLKNTI